MDHDYTSPGWSDLERHNATIRDNTITNTLIDLVAAITDAKLNGRSDDYISGLAAAYDTVCRYLSTSTLR